MTEELVPSGSDDRTAGFVRDPSDAVSDAARHPLLRMLDDTLSGQPPPPDGCTEVVGSPGPPADAVVAFTGHFVVAAGIAAAEVSARCAPGDFSVPMSPGFLLWLAERLGSRPVTHDVVFGGIAGDAQRPVELLPLALDYPHTRVARSLRFRRDVTAFATPDHDGVLVLGRGLAGRWELAFEVAPAARGRGVGRALVASALRLLPAGTPVYAQVATGNVSSMRSVIAGGLRPVCAEVLFPLGGASVP